MLGMSELVMSTTAVIGVGLTHKWPGDAIQGTNQNRWKAFVGR